MNSYNPFCLFSYDLLMPHWQLGLMVGGPSWLFFFLNEYVFCMNHIVQIHTKSSLRKTVLFCHEIGSESQMRLEQYEDE